MRFWQFNAAGYTPFVVDGTEYGEVRQYGNFSFLRMYESGHEVPFYQPAVRIATFSFLDLPSDIPEREADSRPAV